MDEQGAPRKAQTKEGSLQHVEKWTGHTVYSGM